MKMINELDAVDSRLLASNFTDVVPDCSAIDFDPKTTLMNRHPLYAWLINTDLSRRVRENIAGDRAACFLTKGQDGFEIKVPGTFWTLDPSDTTEECCWAPFDFAKCASSVPVKRLCLKDCEAVDDEMLGRFLRVRNDYGIGMNGLTYPEARRRVARLSMAFLTVYNVMYGRTTQTTTVLKPFHGLFEVMSNAAVVSISGANVLAAFDSLICRMRLIGIENAVIAVNPLIKASLDSVVRPNQYNELPNGWARRGDDLTFYGMPIIVDRFVPVDLENSNGEAWVLTSDSVGAWLATDIMPADEFIKESGHNEETKEKGCGSDCTFYYNFGAVFNNNANRIAKIVDIPVSGVCAASTADLNGLIMPTTLIPNL